jgi:hypothetical protein
VEQPEQEHRKCGGFLEVLLKIQRHLPQLLTIRILIAISAHSIQLLATAQRTNLEAFDNGAVNFLNLDFVYVL